MMQLDERKVGDILDESGVALRLTADAIKRWAEQVEELSPQDAITFALRKFGRDCSIAFSGAEDVVLIEFAVRSGYPFSVFYLDTGRLHPETYEFIERVRVRYGVAIDAYWPERATLERLVREKGLFSFYSNGHQECCAVRKVEPLRRALSKYRMWITGQRRDQSPTRRNMEVLQLDPTFSGVDGRLLKLNPMASMTLSDVWGLIRQAKLPYNTLHERGFVSIGCAPCTREVLPGEHERAGRWSWEVETKRECGIHEASLANHDL